MGVVALLGLALAAAAPRALAHGVAPVAAASVPPLWQWLLEPWVLVLLALSALWYALGVLRLWRNAGLGRGISRMHAAAFAGGWLTLVLALVSPLDALGARLFSAHMLQHELLMLVAAPLLVLGQPLAAWTWALSPAQRQVVGRWTRVHWWAATWALLTDPLAAWALHALALWLWHLPSWFEAALHNEGWHALQHASFLVTALLFWWAVAGGDARARTGGFAMLYLFTTMLHTGALGALLTMAPTPWYPTYAASTGALGLDPLEDQQLGGLVMWVPGSVAYLIAGLVVMARLLARPAITPTTAARPGLPR
jgi:putative membrane protein